MRLDRLEYGALLSYAPRGDSEKITQARDTMLALKNDKLLQQQQPPILTSQAVAQIVKARLSILPFSSFFLPNTIFVPVPRSSLMQRDSLWVPNRLALALVANGLGKEVAPCLVRVNAVPKAAHCAPSDRPKAQQHYDSIAVQGKLSEPEEIVLVDDVVTRGATFIGAANRLVEAFPTARIRAFAAMRTISNSFEFEDLYKPIAGEIVLWPSGETFRS